MIFTTILNKFNKKMGKKGIFFVPPRFSQFYLLYSEMKFIIQQMTLID